MQSYPLQTYVKVHVNTQEKSSDIRKTDRS